MSNFVPVVYSNGASVMCSDGVTRRVACPHLAQWLNVYDALQVAHGRGHVGYYQTMGYSSASGGTHGCGSAWDMEYHGSAPIMDAREMGAADYPRLHSNGWVGGEHVHGVISCGDNACNKYQYSAYLAGYNGLGANGHGARDPLPRPSTIRSWQNGIVWAQAEIARLTGPMTINTQEDNMSTFMQLKGDPTKTVYLTDGITARAIPSEESLANLAWLAAQGLYHITQPAASEVDAVNVDVGGVRVRVRVVSDPGVIGKVL